MENKIIPTAEEMIDKWHVKAIETMGTSEHNPNLLGEIMIEFAKLHVEAALKHASEKAELSNKPKFSGDYNLVVDEESILNSYPLNKIK